MAGPKAGSGDGGKEVFYIFLGSMTNDRNMSLYAYGAKVGRELGDHFLSNIFSVFIGKF